MEFDKSTRRDFIKATAAIVAGGLAIPIGLAAKDKTYKLAFSTIGCPDWDFQQITEFAAAHGYQGLEFRGLQRELDLTKTPEFGTADGRKRTMARMADLSLHFVGFGASTRLHISEPKERKKQLDEAKRFIDLAAEVHCPYIRVFPDRLPEDRDKGETLGLIAEGLTELADYARDVPVEVLLETHGDVVYAADIVQVMRAVNHQQVGLIWDIFNMWIKTGEDPVAVYKQLAPYIRHVHLKDGKREDNGIAYTLMGQGSAPIAPAIRLLKKSGYTGYYSFEWEKLWHANLLEPEVAFADFPSYMKQVLSTPAR